MRSCCHRRLAGLARRLLATGSCRCLQYFRVFYSLSNHFQNFPTFSNTLLQFCARCQLYKVFSKSMWGHHNILSIESTTLVPLFNDASKSNPQRQCLWHVVTCSDYMWLLSPQRQFGGKERFVLWVPMVVTVVPGKRKALWTNSTGKEMAWYDRTPAQQTHRDDNISWTLQNLLPGSTCARRTSRCNSTRHFLSLSGKIPASVIQGLRSSKIIQDQILGSETQCFRSRLVPHTAC